MRQLAWILGAVALLAGAAVAQTNVEDGIREAFRGPVRVSAPTTNQVLTWNGTAWVAAAAAGGTDLTGLGTDNRIARWDGTDTLQGSSVSLADTGQVSWAAGLGAIAHVLGPSDQPLDIRSAASRNLTFTAGSAADIFFTATDTQVSFQDTANGLVVFELGGTETLRATETLLTLGTPIESAAGTDLVLRPAGTGAAASRKLQLKGTPNAGSLKTFVEVDPDQNSVLVDPAAGTASFGVGSWLGNLVWLQHGAASENPSVGLWADSATYQAPLGIVEGRFVNSGGTLTTSTGYLDLLTKVSTSATAVPFLRLNGDTNVADIGSRLFAAGSAIGTNDTRWGRGAANTFQVTDASGLAGQFRTRGVTALDSDFATTAAQVAAHHYRDTICAERIDTFSATATDAPEIDLVRGRGTAAVPTIVSDGDRLGVLVFRGAASGAGHSAAATLRVEVDGTPGAASDMPGRFVCALSPDDSATPTERMRIRAIGTAFLGDGTLATGITGIAGGEGGATYALTAYRDSACQFHQFAFSTTAGNGPIVRGVRGRGTAASPAALVADDLILNLNAYGFISATQVHEFGSVKLLADGAVAVNDSPGRIEFYTTPDASGTPVERLRINNAGVVYVGNGPTAASPAASEIRGTGHNGTGTGGTLSIYGGAGGTTSGTPGQLTLSGGNVFTGQGGPVWVTGSNGSGSNNRGGDVRISGGNPAGTGRPGVAYFDTVAGSPTMIVGGRVALTDNTAVTILTIPLTSGQRVSGRITYGVDCSDGTDHQTYRGGLITFAAVDKAGTLTSDLDELAGTASQAVSAGTLTVTPTVLDGTNQIEIQVNANSSLTPTTLNIGFNVELYHSGNATVTVP